MLPKKLHCTPKRFAQRRLNRSVTTKVCESDPWCSGGFLMPCKSIILGSEGIVADLAFPQSLSSKSSDLTRWSASLKMEGDELDRTLHLFLTHAYDAELHVRHTAALDKLCKGGNGFAVRDLPRVNEILDCTLDLVLSQHAATFLGPACSLIRYVWAEGCLAGHQTADGFWCNCGWTLSALPQQRIVLL